MQLQGIKLKKAVGFSLAFASLFLSGCQGWTGVAAERYDGQKISKDTDAIDAYQERQEIKGKAKELYLLESFSPEIGQSVLPFIEKEPVFLETKTYEIGKDLPASRYILTYADWDKGSGHVRVEDSEGRLIAEEFIHPHIGVQYFTADLHEGDKLQMTGTELGDLVALTTEEIPTEFTGYGGMEEMVLEEDTVNIQTGIWQVGTHIEPGEYELVDQPGEGFVYLFESEGAEPVLIELNGQTVDIDPHTFEVITTGDPIPLILSEGQVLYLQNTNRIQLAKKK